MSMPAKKKATKTAKPSTKKVHPNHQVHPQSKLSKTFMEIVERKPRQAEEKFFFVFSKTQLTAVSILLLASTFLVQGIIQFLQYLDKSQYIKPWFMIIVTSIVFLTTSTVLITLDSVIKPIKIKTKVNVLAFVTYLIGFVVFLASVIFLIFILI